MSAGSFAVNYPVAAAVGIVNSVAVEFPWLTVNQPVEVIQQHVVAMLFLAAAAAVAAVVAAAAVAAAVAAAAAAAGTAASVVELTATAVVAADSCKHSCLPLTLVVPSLFVALD